jgi:hypothetical protein
MSSNAIELSLESVGDWEAAPPTNRRLSSRRAIRSSLRACPKRWGWLSEPAWVEQTFSHCRANQPDPRPLRRSSPTTETGFFDAL